MSRRHIYLCCVWCAVLAHASLCCDSTSTRQPSNTKARSASAVVQILAFGDSLTAGYDATSELHPYSVRLAELLSLSAERNVKYNITQLGVGGERATHMTGRLADVLADAQATNFKFDWLLILGGINDVNGAVNASEILQALHEIYSMALQQHITVLAMTLMETTWSAPGTDRNEQRLQVNAELRRFFAENANSSLHLFDLEVEYPYYNLSSTEITELCVDGLHPTGPGYDLMAEKMFLFMLPLLPVGAGPSASCSDVHSHAHAAGDGLFEKAIHTVSYSGL